MEAPNVTVNASKLAPTEGLIKARSLAQNAFSSEISKLSISPQRLFCAAALPKIEAFNQ
ncbi:hypothetical protein [Pseudomonas sp. DWP3-1-2]|uniref:hypothetical protein n=1 Tax=Pseudomonas sp. DWP3-1-2 TaxID=2804645 RepID=UPI003CE7F977